MTEAELQRGLVEAARALGYLVFHATVARRSETGFPDLLIVGHGRVLAWECKTERGRVRPASVTRRGRYLPGQMDWIEAFRAAGIDARIVRPSDYDAALAALREAVTA